MEFAGPIQATMHNTTQRGLVSHVHKITLRALRTGMDDDAAAFLRSASGKGVGAFLEVPMDERWVMSNRSFATACLRRLNVPWPAFKDPPVSPPRCGNKTAAGRICNANCDAAGKHQENCAPGGGLVNRHDRLVRCLGQLSARNLDPRPRLEQILPERSRLVAGQVEQARLDVVVHDGASRILLDAVIVSSYAGDASFRRACARRAVRRAEMAKRSRYPSAELVPFAVDTGGRLGTSARAYLVRCAQASDDPNRELVYLYRAVSSVIQSGVVQMLQS